MSSRHQLGRDVALALFPGWLLQLLLGFLVQLLAPKRQRHTAKRPPLAPLLHHHQQHKIYAMRSLTTP